MGASMVYLPEPVTAKHSEDGGEFGACGLHYGATGMQGWRRNMEDAHLAVPDFGDGVGLFGVFDGHGGRGVARFAARRLPGLIRETEAFRRGDYAGALERAFLLVDERLREPAGRREVEDLDQPDGGAPAHPVLVPRRAIQRFLAGGGAEEADGDAPGAPAAAPAAAPAQARGGGGRADATGGAEPAAPAAPAEPGGEEEVVVEAFVPGDEEWSAERLADERMVWVDPGRLTRDPAPEAQGCTAVVVLVARRPAGGPAEVICANAGDSRAIMSRGGQVLALSDDHKPENAEETARITKAGGYVHLMPGGARVQGDLNLSRALGDLRYKRPEDMPPEAQILTAFPEVRTFALREEDEFVVLACDGIWERSSNEEVLAFVRDQLARREDGDGGPASVSGICEGLCDRSLCPSFAPAEGEEFDGTGCDNMTVMVVQLRERLAGARDGGPVGGPAGGPAKRVADEAVPDPPDQAADGSGGKRLRTGHS